MQVKISSSRYFSEDPIYVYATNLDWIAHDREGICQVVNKFIRKFEELMRGIGVIIKGEETFYSLSFRTFEKNTYLFDWTLPMACKKLMKMIGSNDA